MGTDTSALKRCLRRRPAVTVDYSRSQQRTSGLAAAATRFVKVLHEPALRRGFVGQTCRRHAATVRPRTGGLRPLFRTEKQ